jgi:hypothetical protein
MSIAAPGEKTGFCVILADTVSSKIILVFPRSTVMKCNINELAVFILGIKFEMEF